MKTEEQIEAEILRKKTLGKFFSISLSTMTTMDIFYDYNGEVKKFFDAFKEFKPDGWKLYFLDKYYKIFFEVTSQAPHHFINVKQVKLYEKGDSMLNADDPDLNKQSFLYSEGSGHSESGALYFYYIYLALNGSSTKSKYRFCTEKDHPSLVTPMMKELRRLLEEE